MTLQQIAARLREMRDAEIKQGAELEHEFIVCISARGFEDTYGSLVYGVGKILRSAHASGTFRNEYFSALEAALLGENDTGAAAKTIHFLQNRGFSVEGVDAKLDALERLALAIEAIDKEIGSNPQRVKFTPTETSEPQNRPSGHGAVRLIKVFIASPGDLTVERRAFKEMVDRLNDGFGRGADVTFQPLGWEDALAQTGRRPQSVINQDVDACDLFVLVMWRRWGQDAPDAAPFSSYTEEEFNRAVTRFERTGSPKIIVFFKNIDQGQMADPGEQLKKVLVFRAKLEKSRKVLHRPFDDEKAFRNEIDHHLVAFARGAYETINEGCEIPILPDSVKAEIDRNKAEALEEIRKLKAEAQKTVEELERARAAARDATARADAAENVAEAKAAKRSLELAEFAAKAALDGKVEEARQCFAKALDGTTNLRVLDLGGQFFERIGELDEAERLLRRSLAISGPDAQTISTATTYGNLGKVLMGRGDMSSAETVVRKALAIYESLGSLPGMASGYAKLGILLKFRGDLSGAEALYRRAIEIDEKLARPESLANHCGNLGNVLQMREDLDGAEAMYRKALAIDEKLGLPEGMADNYGNIGILLHKRGDLNASEAMHRKALEINKKIGRRECMGNNYCNLGILLEDRREFEAAEAMYREALALHERVGLVEGIATACGNLGNLLRGRNDLDGAEALYRKAIAIDEKLGRAAGMANGYANFGLLLEARSDLKGAHEMLVKSRDCFRHLGMQQKVNQVEDWIHGLEKMPSSPEGLSS